MVSSEEFANNCAWSEPLTIVPPPEIVTVPLISSLPVKVSVTPDSIMSSPFSKTPASQTALVLIVPNSGIVLGGVSVEDASSNSMSSCSDIVTVICGAATPSASTYPAGRRGVN